MKKRHFLSLLCIAAVLAACTSVPKNEKKTYARVKDWRSNLNLRDLEQQYDLPKGLLSALMHQESRGIATARSPVGAEGLFQIMPATARDLKLESAYHPESAAQAAAKYLSRLYKHYDGNLKYTLAAYNWGIGNVDKYGLSNMPTETKNYIARVKKFRKFYD